jgi:hypothetical protein
MTQHDPEPSIFEYLANSALDFLRPEKISCFREEYPTEEGRENMGAW